MISLRNIVFKYGKRVILRNITTDIQDGVTYVIGPNGAGKTTLLKIAAGIYKPSSGEVIVDGINIWDVDEAKALEVRRRIIYVHERPAVLRGTVLKNIVYGFKLRGVNDTGEVLRIVKPIAEEINVVELLWKNAGELSAGQLQKVALVRAIALRPRYLLLDEPFSHLDEESVKRVSYVLRRIVEDQGVCVVVASHIREAVEGLSPRVVMIREGELVKVSPEP
ncbi:MAG TPA: energy-coupling factor ABC transporter ATP-binding protein [Candidatus Caldiarchaeum subterraneum]|uniref:Energy-coupling factor ABC transporter ATP-binding protein n=1 Tax=Caldiarchaeum subterraneum TaxID=311458 RepID=A0A832ZZ97_CALS0|nr:energy-coupling factor ABC transporter ATP-binding protein [Candidatus Caldarchaeum subterraneum]